MKTSSAFRFWSPAVLPAVWLGAALSSFPSTGFAQAPHTQPQTQPQPQNQQAATQAVLEKAHALELRGRMDLATQFWQQVLLADPNNTEALGGLARAARLGGNNALASTYIDKLRAINPNDPGIARAEATNTGADHNVQLRQAGKLAQQGQYAQSMDLYRQVYGIQPPPGDQALAYYETEAATEDGRPHAIAGLRGLAQKFPSDARYQVALGRILTYNPKTRVEGRKLLEAHSNDPEAAQALRQSLLWDAQNPATAGDIRTYLATHNDAQLATILRSEPRTGRRAAPLTAEQRAQAAVTASRNGEDRAAYAALNAKHIAEAEARFKVILAKKPDDANALAGMGYIQMQQANFGGAISFLSQARQDGSKDPGLDNALMTSRFFYTLGEGAIALNADDLPRAETQYRAALAMRATSPEALEGLGGTLLKAQQPEAAVPVFAEFVKVNPAAPHAWRGLFIAESGAGDVPRALGTERQFPPAVRADLMKDPLFLRSLSSAYLAAGRDADAQQVLRSALDLPFPANSSTLEVDTKLQYAGLLQAANHFDQAAGMFRDVLAKNPNNVAAWQGLVRAEHGLDRDDEALNTVESMPPAVYAKAMSDTGFEQTVASIYQSGKRLDVAQDILEKALAQQTTAGQKPSVPAEIQLAGIYLQRDDPQQAYPLYRAVLTESPGRTDAWKGLLSALHTTGRDSEVLAEVQQIPPGTRAKLEQDPDFLQTIGSSYNALGEPREAELFLRRVQQHYARQGVAPPSEVDIQNAYLLYSAGNDRGLYSQLLELGGRNDLTDAQRRTVETIWALFAVRRANQVATAGNTRLATDILNATARSFPDNPEVIKTLAGGYASAGASKQAILIWKSEDLKSAPVADYRAAVGAALAANDLKDAETWLRFGLDQNPKDPDLLILAAKFEQARGDNSRAADYYRASLDAMPAPDPGAELAGALGRPGPSTAPTMKPGQDLTTLLKPGKDDRNDGMEQSMRSPDALPASAPARPYLPSGGAGMGAPVPLYNPGNSGTQTVPFYPMPPGNSGNPNQAMPAYPAPPQPGTPAGATHLRDYTPQPVPQAVLHRPRYADSMQPVVAMADGTTPPVMFLLPAVYLQQTTPIAAASPAQQNQGVQTHSVNQSGPPPPPAPILKPGPLTAEPAAAQQASPSPTSPSAAGEVYGAYVPYHPPQATQVQLGATPAAQTPVQPEVTDVLPTAHYVPNANSRPATSSHPEVNAATAAEARRRKSVPERTGQSQPPAEDYTTTPTEGVQYNPAAAAQSRQQVPQPNGTAPQTNSYPNTYQNSNAPQGGNGTSQGQQYPQPGSSSPYIAPRVGRGRARARTHVPAPAVAGQPAPAAPVPQPAYQGLSYPGVGQSLSYQPYPSIGPSYPLGVPPSDADLMARRLPPLRGGYDTEVLPAPMPLTPRQQAERDLQTLESSYSGWLGGTVSARYRSGTQGLDRLTDLETTFEASATVGNNVRFTIVPKAVFLNSGTIDLTQYAGANVAAVPFLGSLALNSINQPAQQNTSGVGGELQVTGNRFAVAAGYTPYEFLVRNVTGRALFLPNRHVTLYFNRDSVTETQLSYAGQRDPGSATAVYAGNIWGGVVATGGGVRYEMGDAKAGFYLTADGADLTGYHVLQNSKFEASAGAYFLAHTFPGYGRLNIGASAFGMHYAHNERGLSYGLGGYFSPDAYFLASVPVTFAGRYGNNFHYTLAGSVGVQTFQEDSQIDFPLDRGLQSAFQSVANGTTAAGAGIPCTTAQIVAGTCISLPKNSNTGGNYSINSEGAYRIADHWFAGGFLSANNTNNYNTVTGGFFVRYLFRPQYGTDDYPTGLFPVDGFRPLRVP